MRAQDAYAQYGKNKIMTASPAELTLMLYEGCVKFINIAKMGIEEKNIEKAHVNIRKAERIIEEFQATLDYKYPVAEDFNRVYVYVKKRLHEANIEKSVEILEECAVHMRSMRDTWREVMKKVNSSEEGRRVGEA
ncbi:flagellar export chaperone FliS [Lachnospiraceae bacterium C1.1]|nr:flagellar export chaperone FliS [Lachnospiraceae bacterium C1.1]